MAIGRIRRVAFYRDSGHRLYNAPLGQRSWPDRMQILGEQSSLVLQSMFRSARYASISVGGSNFYGCRYAAAIGPFAGIVKSTLSQPPAFPSAFGPTFSDDAAHTPSSRSVRNTWPRPSSSEITSSSGNTTVAYL